MRLNVKIVAIVLVLTLFMSVSAFAETLVEGTNGKTITLSIVCASDDAGTTPVKSVKAGDFFYMCVFFEGNPTTVRTDSIYNYNLLIEYDSSKMRFDYKYNKLTTPTVNPTFNTGLFYASWASSDPIANGRTVYESGQLFAYDATALTDLTEEDLNNIKFVAEGVGSGGTAQSTKLADGNDPVGHFTVAVPDPAPSITGSIESDTVTVTSSEDLGDNLTVFVGVYNSNDELVDAKFEAYDPNGNDFLVDTRNASYYKAFVWDANQNPAVASVKF